MCSDPVFSRKDHDDIHAGQCPECKGDVDVNGDTCEINHCTYSPLACDSCGYRPCDGSC